MYDSLMSAVIICDVMDVDIHNPTMVQLVILMQGNLTALAHIGSTTPYSLVVS